jgi:hypothetical protein
MKSDCTQTPPTCRWAQPKVYVPMPCWADAWGGRWICVRDSPGRLLEKHSECTACSQWETRADAHVSWAISQVSV